MSRMLLTARCFLIRPSQLVSTLGNSKPSLAMITWRPSSTLSKCQSIALVRAVNGTQTSITRWSTSDAKQPKQDSVATTKSELDKPQWERSDRYKIYYGFDADDEAEDKVVAHVYTFLFFFMFVCGATFLVYYYPDWRLNEWAYREAFLEMSRREKAGGPLVSPDFLPVESIHLPSDQELGDTKIII